MARSIPISLLLMCLTGTVSCASRTRSISPTPPPVTAQEIRTALDETSKACIPGDDRIVRCPTDQFRKLGETCADCGLALERAAAQAVALRATGALDIEAERHRTEAAETELASPWRNPWVTVPIALAVGFGIGFGLGFSQ